MIASDQAVFGRWLTHRDAAAFRTLADRHGAMIYATCRRILRNEQDAEDVTQECFEALASAPEVAQPRRFHSWLHGMATNKCLQRIRSDGRRHQREAEYAAAQPHMASPQWDDIYEHIDKIITSLPDELRIPVVAHFLGGLSHRAIARDTGVPRRTVSHRIGKGVECIGTELRKRGIAAPAALLAGILNAGFSEAVTIPASLTASLGRLALAHARTGAAVAVVGGSAVLWTKMIVGIAIVVAAIISGIWLLSGSEPEIAAPDLVADLLDNPSPSNAIDASDPPRPAPEHDSTGTITGTVRLKKTGEPVSGITVKYARNDEWVESSATVSDERGTYVLTRVEPGVAHTIRPFPVWTYLRTNDGEVTLADGEDACKGVDLYIEAGGVISGTVLDKTITYNPSALATVADILSRAPGKSSEEAVRAAYARVMSEANTPVAGVKVLLAMEGNDGIGHPITDTVTDAHGHFAFPSIRPGNYAVQLVPPAGAVHMQETDRSRMAIVTVPPNTDVTVELSLRFDAVSVTGRVSGRDGTPIANAEVAAVPLEIASHEESGRVATATVQARTGADGRYLLEGLCPASAGEAIRYTNRGPLPSGGRTYQIRVKAEGYASAQIVVPAVSNDVLATANQLLAANERYGLPNNLEGMVREFAEAVLPQSTGNSLSGIDFVLDRGAAVSGHVVDSIGRSLREYLIGLVPEPQMERTNKPMIHEFFIADPVPAVEDGRFKIDSIAEGAYRFVVRIPSTYRNKTARNEPIIVQAGERIDNVTVVIESETEWGSLTGSVLDAVTRAPIRNYRLSVKTIESPSEPHPSLGAVAVSEPDGTFRISDLSPGFATLSIFADGYVPTDVIEEILIGEERDTTIALPAEGVIEGYIRVNGTPTSGNIIVRRSDGQPIVSTQGYAGNGYTDSNEVGYYRFGGLPPGEYVVTAGGVTGQAETTYFRYGTLYTQIQSGRVTQLDFDLTGASTVRGWFEFPEKYRRGRVNLLEGDATGLEPGDDTDYSQRMRAATERMRQSGEYEFTAVPPGTYTLTAFCYNNRELEGTGEETDRPRMWQVITVPNGEVVEADLRVD